MEDLSGTVLLTTRSGIIAETFRGVADPATGAPPGPSTRFGTASITKMFTALAVVILAERGAFSLQAPVADVLPDAWYPPALARSASLHNLLTHTSGVPDYIPDDPEDTATPDLWAALGGAHIRDAAGFVPILRALPAGTPPTAVARYCNTNYVILGLVLEATTGQTFQQVIEAEVMRPAGMSSSGFLPLDVRHPDVAVGLIEGGGSNAGLLPVAGSPDGGAYCTSGDLVRFLVALHQGELISRNLRRAVLTRWAQSASGETGYGYGQILWERGGRHWYGHTGGDAGVSACAFHSPADGVCLVVLSNHSRGGGAAWRRIAEQLPALV